MDLHALRITKRHHRQQTHKRTLLFVECKPIQPGFRVLDKPTSEMVDGNPFGVNLNVEMLLVNEPARITNDSANVEAATIASVW